MSYYYVVPAFLTVLFVFCCLFVRFMLAFFDRFNFFWDWWDSKRKAFPALIIVEIAYFGAILYYIVYCELSGSA